MRIDDSILKFRSVSGNKIVVPIVKSDELIPSGEGSGQSLRASILWIHHNKFLHPGSFRLYQSVARSWYWPSLAADIRRYLKSCLVCSMRLPTRGDKGDSELSSVTDATNQVFDQIMIDYFSLDDHNVLLIIDCFSHFAFSRHVSEATAFATAQALFEVMCYIGVPTVIFCDNGGTFANEIISELSKLFGFRLSFSSPYHPRRNGLVETLVKEIKASIKSGMIEVKHGLSHDSNGDFDLWLKIATLNHNRSPFAYYDISPYEIVFGRPIREVDKPVDLIDSIVPDLQGIRDCWRYVRTNRYSYIQDRYAANQIHSVPFIVGDQVVWRCGPNISIEVLDKRIATSSWALRSGPIVPENQLKRFTNIAGDLQVSQSVPKYSYKANDIVLIRVPPEDDDLDVDEYLNVGKVLSLSNIGVVVEEYFCNDSSQWFSHGNQYVKEYKHEDIVKACVLTKQNRVPARVLKSCRVSNL